MFSLQFGKAASRKAAPRLSWTSGRRDAYSTQSRIDVTDRDDAKKITNDDGPPSTQSSPYVLDFVRTLQANGHTVSVCLPHTQRSWVGKAHIVGQPIRPSYYRPAKRPEDNAHSSCDQGVTSHQPLSKSSNEEEWILVDSTPASCIQIGLYHYFQERGPVDLVISGPNYGRNTTAVFALSSGTIGGAMEAAVCGVKAIALSYAFFDRTHDPEMIAAASRTATRVIEGLYKIWEKNCQLYSVNVPLLPGVETTKVLYASMLQNTWTSGSCFTEVEVPESEDRGPEAEEQEIRRSESNASEAAEQDMIKESERKNKGSPHLRYKHKHFKWTPTFKDVHESVERAPPGNDGWAIKEGFVSITPLRANFQHIEGMREGEVKL